MGKYSLVMTPTPCRVAGCIISIRPTHSHALIVLYPEHTTIDARRAVNRRQGIQRNLYAHDDITYNKPYMAFDYNAGSSICCVISYIQQVRVASYRPVLAAIYDNHFVLCALFTGSLSESH